MTIDKRKFVITVDKTIYIKKIYFNGFGYYYQTTKYKEKAKFWKFEKGCKKVLEKISNNLDPTKRYLKLKILDISEITDIKTLRDIKINKLNKK